METSRLNVRLTPRASKDEVSGFVGETLQVRVTAVPVDGRANEALLRLLARTTKVPRSSVRIVAGHASREKVVAIDGVASEELHRRLGRSS